MRFYLDQITEFDQSNISSDLKKNPNSWDIVSFEVEPGDAVVLHPHCLHRGGGTSDTLPERKNIVFRFFQYQ